MSASLSTLTFAKNPRLLSAGSEFVNNFLNRQAPVEVNKLGNGFRVASQEGGPNEMATISLHSKTGSRFDSLENNGCSALMQKAMWYGTQTKSAAEVQAALKSIGGRIEFEHGREHQSVTINCLGADASKAIELIADVAKNPKLDTAAIDAARADVINNMKEFENSVPSQVIHNMYNQAYDSTKYEGAGAGMALSPWGTGDNVKVGLTAADVQSFHKQFASNANTMALVATGNVSTSAVMEAAQKNFGDVASTPEAAQDKRYTGGAARMDSGNLASPYSNHVALGWEICPASNADVIPLRILTEVFGNYDRFMNDMTSNWWIRFNVERQSTQIGYQPLEEVRTIFDTFSDTGLQGFYFTHNMGCMRDEGWFFLVALQNEWIRYCMRLTPYQVEVGKNLLKSNLLFENDGSEKTNMNIGKQLISKGTYTPLEQAFARIDDVTTQQVSDTMNHYYYDREPVLSSWGIYYTLPIYNTARRNMYKYRY
eukprot:TRINITY_DN15544_c0_g2_i1.p1 TRINITY_DN15544_c0_g2~~TRINITY_DN15544_c0_g2_i1.p1  ORF type:complete len:500 (+),score=215.48 TRINITY_DN15544_c0_g2_i1:49-1500(+)